MQIGPGGKGMAVSVKLGFDSRQLGSRDRDYQFRSLFAATAPDGKTISWPELRRLVVHQPAFNLVGSVGIRPAQASCSSVVGSPGRDSFKCRDSELDWILRNRQTHDAMGDEMAISSQQRRASEGGDRVNH